MLTIQRQITHIIWVIFMLGLGLCVFASRSQKCRLIYKIISVAYLRICIIAFQEHD